jgi:cell division protein FtsL
MEYRVHVSAAPTGMYLRRRCRGVARYTEIRSGWRGRNSAQSARAQRATPGLAKGSVSATREPARRDTPTAKRHTHRRRGRSVMATLLIGFVIVASAVIWRRSYGITQARQIADLNRRIVQLSAERGRLAALIRDESSRTQLGRVVQQLGMRVPDDPQVRLLRR